MRVCKVDDVFGAEHSHHVRRIAWDGKSYAEKEFFQWYGTGYRDIWDRAIGEMQPLPGQELQSGAAKDAETLRRTAQDDTTSSNARERVAATTSSASENANTVPNTSDKPPHTRVDPFCTAGLEPQSYAAEQDEPLRCIAHDDTTSSGITEHGSQTQPQWTSFAVSLHEKAMPRNLDSEFMNALLDRLLSTDQTDEEGVPFVSESSLCSMERALPAVKTEERREIARKAEAYVAIFEILVLIPGSLGEKWAEMAAESPNPPAFFSRAHQMRDILLQMGFMRERAISERVNSRRVARQLTEELLKRRPVMWYGKGAGKDVRGWMWLDDGPDRGWVDWENPEDKAWRFTFEDGWTLEP